MWLDDQGVREQIRKALGPVLMRLWQDAWKAGQAGDVHSQAVADQMARFAAEWLDQVTQTRVDRIAEILAKGGTAAELQASIKGLLEDSSDARMVAITEITRAMNAAAIAAYLAAGVQKVRWITRSANPCPICLANEAAGPRYLGEPFPSGSTAPPEHPNCECALIPADEERVA